MTSIKKIDSISNKPKPILTPANTGYVAAGALLLASVRAGSKNKNVIKTHKIFGYIALALTALHIGLIESYHLKKRKG